MKKTMLTCNVLDRFENLTDVSELTPEQVERVEHLAYCACMGSENNAKAWEHFAGLVNKELGLDIPDKPLKRYTVDYDILRGGKYHHRNTVWEAKSIADARKHAQEVNVLRKEAKMPHMFHVEIHPYKETSGEALGRMLGMKRV